MKHYFRNMSFTVRRRDSVLRSRDVTIAAAARSVTLFGDLLAVTSLVLVVQGRGDSAWAVAALFVAGLLPVVLLAPAVGRLVDRTSSRPLLVGGGLAAAAVCAAMTV